MMSRWQRDRLRGRFGGVCAGVARGLGVSPVTVRLVALFALILMPTLALAVYLAGWLLLTPAAEWRRWLE